MARDLNDQKIKELKAEQAAREKAEKESKILKINLEEVKPVCNTFQEVVWSISAHSIPPSRLIGKSGNKWDTRNKRELHGLAAQVWSRTKGEK